MTYLISNLSLNNNSVQPLKQFNKLWAVQKYNNITKVVSNSCLHRGAIIVDEPQPFHGNLVCPLHRWTYDQHGVLLGSPFDTEGCLPTITTHEWNNFLFTKPMDINFPKHLVSHFDTSNYVHTKTEIMKLNFSWEIFIEVYLDLYHVKPFHPGLGNFVDMNHYKWHFGDNWSIQEVKYNKSSNNPNPHFNELQKMIRSNYSHVEHGALWATIYPNMTLEWYPNMIVMSTVWPDTDKTCFNLIEYHHIDSVSAFDQDFVETQLAAYHSTALEDVEIGERIQHGRKLSYDNYPYHPQLELGIAKFYEHIDKFSDYFVVK